VLVAVELDTGEAIVAAAYPDMIGELTEGNRVVVNVTALELGLGTGGVGFVLWNLSSDPDDSISGHIMKLRYTPWQRDVLAAEAPESPHHERLAEVVSIGGVPVVACGLHSQVAAVAAGIRSAAPEARIGYLMTDSAALPLALSDLVRSLEEAGLLHATCTAGHAFGGDLEATNVFSGMAALVHAASCDVVVAGMGPGVVGTGTRLGFTAMEQGQLLDAATALGGRSIAALRVSFDDERERHEGISHHTLTALAIAAREPTTIAVPKLAPERSNLIARQLRESGGCDRHATQVVDGRPALVVLGEVGLDPTTMGRPMSDSPESFLAAGAAGVLAGEWVAG
jgi:hypothetical protein